jgi:hypothetical protein
MRSEDEMELRDQIAIAVLPAIYADYVTLCRNLKVGMDEFWREGLALDAYHMADAMIAVRTSRLREAGAPVGVGVNIRSA